MLNLEMGQTLKGTLSVPFCKTSGLHSCTAVRKDITKDKALWFATGMSNSAVYRVSHFLQGFLEHGFPTLLICFA